MNITKNIRAENRLKEKINQYINESREQESKGQNNQKWVVRKLSNQL